MFWPPAASEEEHSSRASTETIRHQYWVPARSKYHSSTKYCTTGTGTAGIGIDARTTTTAATTAAITIPAATATATETYTNNANDANDISYFQNLFYRPKSTENGGVGAGVASSIPSPSSGESTSQNWRESVPFQVMLHGLQIPDGLTVGDLIDIHQEVLRILSDIQNELQAFRQTA